MTEDLRPVPGRVFVGVMYGSPKLLTVKSVRRRRDGTPSSCILLGEDPSHHGPVRAEYRLTLPKWGELTGFRRVTLARVGTARKLADDVGEHIPTDAVVIVTRDRTGGGPVLDGEGIS